MDRKLVLGLGLVIAAALVGGCGGDDDPSGTPDGGARDSTTPPPPPGDAGPGDSGMMTIPDPPGNMTYDYVVNALQIGEESATVPGESPGFDLDAHNTASETDPIGCGWVDFRAPAVYGGTQGVDNQLGPLLRMIADLGLDFDANMTIAENIAMGDLLLLVRVTGVGSLSNDGNVTVQFFLGKLMSGQTPMLDGMMRLSSGQTFLVDPVSVEGGNLEMPRISFRNAVITNGRLHGGPSLFALNVPVSDLGTLALDVQEAQVSFDITETTLTNGLVGGYVDVDEVVTAIMSLMLDIMIPVETVRSVLSGQADIDTNDNTDECEALSLGLTFGAVDADFSMLAPAM